MACKRSPVRAWYPPPFFLPAVSDCLLLLAVLPNVSLRLCSLASVSRPSPPNSTSQAVIQYAQDGEVKLGVNRQGFDERLFSGIVSPVSAFSRP